MYYHVKLIYDSGEWSKFEGNADVAKFMELYGNDGDSEPCAVEGETNGDMWRWQFDLDKNHLSLFVAVMTATKSAWYQLNIDGDGAA